MTCIYGLSERHDSPILYVGQARDEHRRYREHLRAARLGSDTPVHQWMRDIAKETIKFPCMTVLEREPLDIDAAEVAWIAKLQPALNMTEGGAGYSPIEVKVRAAFKSAAVDRARKILSADSNGAAKQSNADKRARTIAYRECGHAAWRKCGVCKEYDAVEHLVRKTSGGHVHPACRAEQDRQRLTRR